MSSAANHRLRARQILRFHEFSRSRHTARVTPEDLALARKFAGRRFHAELAVQHEKPWPDSWEDGSAQSIAQTLRHFRLFAAAGLDADQVAASSGGGHVGEVDGAADGHRALGRRAVEPRAPQPRDAMALNIEIPTSMAVLVILASTLIIVFVLLGLKSGS